MTPDCSGAVLVGQGGGLVLNEGNEATGLLPEIGFGFDFDMTFNAVNHDRLLRPAIAEETTTGAVLAAKSVSDSPGLFFGQEQFRRIGGEPDLCFCVVEVVFNCD